MAKIASWIAIVVVWEAYGVSRAMICGVEIVLP